MAPTPTVDRLEYGWLEKSLDWMSWLGISAGLPIGDINIKSITRAAQRKTGLTDAGSPQYMDAWSELLRYVEKADFTSLARVAMRQVMIQTMVNRMLIEDYLKGHPDVMDLPVQRPIFVLGFPRSGTTALQNLLAQDPGRRALEFWELAQPVPVNDDPAIDKAQRIRDINKTLAVAYKVAPEMAQVHEVRATSYEECWSLFANTFAVLNYDIQTGLQPFGHWLLNQNMGWPYREYRRMLQILLHRRPAQNLVLKCPEHLWFLDSLLEVFPDACIVWTHRDPFESLASYCSLISLNRRTYYGSFEPVELGKHISSRFLQGITRAQAVRATVDPKRFYDVRFADFVTDQKATVKDICSHFELPLQDENALDDWLSQKRPDSRGKHHYDASRYGLVREEIYERYGDYIHSFDIALQKDARKN